MSQRLKQWFTGLVMAVGSACTPLKNAPTTAHAPTPEQARWAVYYDKQLPASTFKDYELVVFDRIYHPDFQELKGKAVVLAYLSVGEVHGDTFEQQLLAEQKALMGTRTKWNSYTVDITSKTWERILDEQINDALAKGFDGVMLDTLDSALHLADMDSPARGERAKQAAVKIIQRMRAQHPRMKIMLNRGFEILPEVASSINYALAESILAETDISSGQSKVFPPHTYQTLADQLLQLRRIAPKIKLYTLDYWDLNDLEGMQTLYAIHRARGFIPYVTTPDLRRHTPEPIGTAPSLSHRPRSVEDRDA